MSEHRHSCCGSPAVYRDQSPSHDVLWLVCKEAIVGSANVVGNSLHPFWFQNKDPSTVSQTSLAGFRLHQWYRILCAWLDHTQWLGLFTTKANDDAPSDVNTMPQWKLFSYFGNDWCWYSGFFVQNIPFTLPVILLPLRLHLWCKKIPKDAK